MWSDRPSSPQERSRNDVEFEDVGELVGDQAIQRVGRLIDRQHHAIPIGLGECQHAFGQLARLDVLLLELTLGLEDHQRDLEGEVVLQIGAHLLIGALRVARDPLHVRFDLGVVVDFEVIGRVDVPLEIVVADLVLAVIGDIRRLRERVGNEAGRQQQNGGS
jgi:hypothetical protein